MYFRQHLPPETGASMKTAPIFSTSFASSFETEGSIVLESINNDPFFTFLSINKNIQVYTLHEYAIQLFIQPESAKNW